MMFDRPQIPTSEELIDKFAVKELIEYERFCRDNALWEQMHTCFAEDSTVCISWYQGSGHGFVEASSKMKTHAPHKLNSTLVWLNGNKAAAVTMACIQTRNELSGRLMDLSSYTRLLYTLRREESVWKIVTMDCIYEKDSLVPTLPVDVEPPCLGMRTSYSGLATVLSMEGYRIADNLPGDDRPELTAELFERAAQWLAD